MNLKKIALLPLAMSFLFFGANAYSKEKPIRLSIDCQPLTQRSGAPAVTLSGVVKLKKQPNGSLLGAGKISIRISTPRETILEQKSMAVNAYFDDIVVSTLQAVPKDEESPISQLTLFQKRDDNEEEQSLLSAVELKDGTTYYTQCNLNK